MPKRRRMLTTHIKQRSIHPPVSYTEALVVNNGPIPCPSCQNPFHRLCLRRQPQGQPVVPWTTLEFRTKQ